jgi:hypothetical protein
MLQALPAEVGDMIVVERVEDVATLTSPAYESPVAQCTELMRNSGLAHIEGFRQIADAELGLGQEGDDSDPRRVTQGPKGLGKTEGCLAVQGLEG